MKKTLLLLLFIPLLFASCGSDEKDDDAIKFYSMNDATKKISEVHVAKTFIGLEVYYAIVKGGKGTYKATSSNQDVVANSQIKVQMPYGYGSGYSDSDGNTGEDDKGYLTFTVLKEGTTTITVSDNDGNASTLKVNVTDDIN